MTDRLRIGVYGARGIPSTYSGYETFLTVLLPGLAARGHEVTMYCRTGQVDSDAEFLGVRKRFVPAVDRKALSTLSHGALSSVRARVGGHDVVLAVNVANAVFCAVSRFTGQPVVLNTDGQEWLRGKWGRTARRFFRVSAHLSSHVATGLISDSAAMAELYEQEFSARSTTIPYCWTGLEPSPPTGMLARLGLEPGRYFCQAGRLNPENNAVELAAAYVASSATWPLVVLGAANYDSPVARDLERLRTDDKRVHLIGHVADRSDYASLVQHAGMYFHTHSIGGINPSLVEAMGLGARILALDTPFNREALGDAGDYFETFGPNLTHRIDAAEEEPKEASAKHRSAVRERVSRHFSTQAIVDAYEDVLIAAAQRRPLQSGLALATQWRLGGPA